MTAKGIELRIFQIEEARRTRGMDGPVPESPQQRFLGNLSFDELKELEQAMIGEDTETIASYEVRWQAWCHADV